MKNKEYFTPDIEDMSVGCEFEMDDTWGGWKKLTLTKDLLSNPMVSLGSGNERTPWYHRIRVPYLTKEQIEAEGWEYVKNTNTVDIDICHIFNKENFMLGWFPLINKIALLVRDPSKAFDKNGILVEYNNTERYTGSCKDINTFRLIQKLLGIK